MQRVHPIYILDRLFKYFFILLLPVIQNLLSENPGITALFVLETIAASFLIGWAILEQKRFYYKIDTKSIVVQKGLLVKERIVIPAENISSMDIEQKLILSLVGAVRIHIDTEAFGVKKADLILLLRKKEGERICREFLGESEPKPYRAGALKTAVAAASYSKAAAGILLVAPVIGNIGALIDKRIESQLYGTITAAQEAAGAFLPPALAALAYLILVGVFVNFMYLYFRQANFTLEKKGDWFLTVRGLVFRRQSLIQVKSIRAVVIRQTPLMRLLRLHQAQINCAGYGKEKGELALAIPAEKLRRLKDELRNWFDLEESSGQMTVTGIGKRGYVIFPAVLLAVTVLLTIAAAILLHHILSLVLLIALIPLALSGLFLETSIRAARNTALSHNFRRLCRAHNFSIIWVYIQPDALRTVEIRQGLMAARAGVCNVWVTPSSEKTNLHIIPGLDYESAVEASKALRRKTKFGDREGESPIERVKV